MARRGLTDEQWNYRKANGWPASKKNRKRKMSKPTELHRFAANAATIAIIRGLSSVLPGGVDDIEVERMKAELAELISNRVPDHATLLSDVAHQLQTLGNDMSKPGIEPAEALTAAAGAVRSLARLIFVELGRGKHG